MLDQKPDSQIVDIFQQKTGKQRRNAFSILYSRHAGKLNGYLKKITRDPQMAQDLTQETFSRALGSLDGFRGQSSFKNWLYRIATNLWKDHLKKMRPSSGINDEEKVNNTDPPKYVQKNEREKAVHQAVEKLPEKLKAPLMLVRFEGMKYKEAASVLEISTDAVRMRVHRAHKELKDTLEDLGILNITS